MLNSASGSTSGFNHDRRSSDTALRAGSEIKKNDIPVGNTVEGVADSSSISETSSEKRFQSSAASRFTPVEPSVKVTISEEASLQDPTQSLPQFQSVYSKSQLQANSVINSESSNLAFVDDGEVGVADTDVVDGSNASTSTTDQAEESSSEQSETSTSVADKDFSDAELEQIADLEKREAEVIRHEQAHAARGGSATGSPQYEYTTGPDGKRYAINGEVSVNFADGDPEQRIADAENIIQAALAPAQPSSQDRAVAREATQRIADAQQELEEIAEQEAQSETEADPTALESVDSESVETSENSSDTVSAANSAETDTAVNLASTATSDLEAQTEDDGVNGLETGSSFALNNENRSNSLNGERKFSSASIAASGPETQNEFRSPINAASNGVEIPVQPTADSSVAASGDQESKDTANSSSFVTNGIEETTRPSFETVQDTNESAIQMEPNSGNQLFRNIQPEQASIETESEVILKDESEPASTADLMTYAKPNSQSSSQFLNQPEPGSLISAMA